MMTTMMMMMMMTLSACGYRKLPGDFLAHETGSGPYLR